MIRLLRINVTKPIRMHKIVTCTTHGEPKRCCLCHQLIVPGQMYHCANKRYAHVSCPRKADAKSL